MKTLYDKLVGIFDSVVGYFVEPIVDPIYVVDLIVAGSRLGNISIVSDVEVPLWVKNEMRVLVEKFMDDLKYSYRTDTKQLTVTLPGSSENLRYGRPEYPR